MGQTLNFIAERNEFVENYKMYLLLAIVQHKVAKRRLEERPIQQQSRRRAVAERRGQLGSTARRSLFVRKTTSTTLTLMRFLNCSDEAKPPNLD